MKILVVDDHALIREALRRAFKELKPDAVVAEAVNSREAFQYVAENPELQLITLDLNLPDRNGLEVLRELRENNSDISVVVLSAYDDREAVSKALDFGALGFIPKSASREIMLSAFNLIFSGGVYIPPKALARSGAIFAPAPPSTVVRAKGFELGLTERQMDVLALMMQGKSNKMICRVLHLAEPTVKSHVTAILRSLNATNRTEAVITAAAMGLGVNREKTGD